MAACLYACSGVHKRDSAAPYYKIERDGVEYYLKQGDEGFVEEIAAKIQKHREKLSPIYNWLDEKLQSSKEGVTAISEDPASREEKADQLFQATIAPLGLSSEQIEKSRKIFDEVFKVTESSATFLQDFRDIISLKRVRIVEFEEFVQKKLPYFFYDMESQRFVCSMGVGVHISNIGENTKISTFGNSKDPLASCVPLFPGEDSKGKNWEYFLDDMSEKMREKIQLPIGEFPIENFSSPKARWFFACHEVAEGSILWKFRVTDPLARWFHDGMANYLAHEAIRQVFSEQDYLEALYGPQMEKQYEADKKQVNLLAWPRADLEEKFLELGPTQTHHFQEAASAAHYFYATKEIRDLAEKQGKDFVPKLFAKLSEKIPINTEKICESILELTGEDFLPRLKSFCPSLSDIGKHAASLNGLLDAIEQGDIRDEPEIEKEIIRILHGAVAAEPRNHQYRRGLFLSLLKSPIEANQLESLFHLAVFIELTKKDGDRRLELKFPTFPQTAAGFHTFGTFLEKTSYISESKLQAKEFYQRALELDPNYTPSKERLEALEQEGIQ